MAYMTFLDRIRELNAEELSVVMAALMITTHTKSFDTLQKELKEILESEFEK